MKMTYGTTAWVVIGYLVFVAFTPAQFQMDVFLLIVAVFALLETASRLVDGK